LPPWLKDISLNSNDIGDAGARALAAPAALPRLLQLRSLNLRDNELGEAGARALVYGVFGAHNAAPAMPRMRALFIGGNDAIPATHQLSVMRAIRERNLGLVDPWLAAGGGRQAAMSGGEVATV
jgi:hypothetical protein